MIESLKNVKRIRRSLFPYRHRIVEYFSECALEHGWTPEQVGLALCEINTDGSNTNDVLTQYLDQSYVNEY